MKQTEKQKAKKREYYIKNKDSIKQYRTQFYLNNREAALVRAKQYRTKYRIKRLVRKYGITEKDYANLKKKQDNSCAICSINFNLLPTKKIHIDHNHSTNKIRGILCQRCNTALGSFKDSTTILKSAVRYLKGAVKC